MGLMATRARMAGILSISLLMLSAPGALAAPIVQYLPDAQIRLGTGPDVGDNILNTDATGQSVFKSAVVGEKLSFFIKIQNDSYTLNDSFKVKRSAGFTNGYRVRYYDAANNDVTGQVNAGSFTTPVLAPSGEYVMKATVKVRSLATEGSSTSRLITVSSVNVPSLRDAVRFTAGVGTPTLTVSPGEGDGGIYDFYFGANVGPRSQLFTITNAGTGPSDVLGFNLSGSSEFSIGTDNCTGATLQANGTCSFQVVFIPPDGCEFVNFNRQYRVTGGVPSTTTYLYLFTYATCLPIA